MRGKPRKCSVRGRVRWYVDGVDSITGKRKRTFFDTQGEAAAHQAQMNAQPAPTHTRHALVDPDVRLDAFAADWFWSRATAPKPWRPATERSYRDHLLLRLLPRPLGTAAGDTLGRVRVRDVTAGHVDALVTG
jgi:hypothetical protein